jgi:hypothetical protein
MIRMLVVGKNSRVFKRYHGLFNQKFDLTAISHVDLIGDKAVDAEFDVVLILSTTRSDDDVANLYHHIRDKICAARFVLLSSLVVKLPFEFDFYTYVKAKKSCERIFQNIFYEQVIFRCGEINDDQSSPVSTDISILLEFLARTSDIKSAVVDLPVIINEYSTPGPVYRLLFQKKLYGICRFMDLIYKASNQKNYGFTFGLFMVLLLDSHKGNLVKHKFIEEGTL